MLLFPALATLCVHNTFRHLFGYIVLFFEQAKLLMSSSAGDAAGSGPCSVCGLVFHVVISTGVLRRLRHGGFHPPRYGTGRRPVGTSHADSIADNPGILDEGMCCLPVPALLEESNTDLSEIFSISSANVGLVRHIPRSARQRAAVVFELCLRDATRVGSLAS